MKSEPFNPFYWLLIVVSVAFVATSLPVAIALAGVPIQTPAWFSQNDWKILLVEMGAIVLLGLLSMGLDRIYRWVGAANARPADAAVPRSPSTDGRSPVVSADPEFGASPRHP